MGVGWKGGSRMEERELKGREGVGLRENNRLEVRE